jgi:hypothetical protein
MKVSRSYKAVFPLGRQWFFLPARIFVKRPQCYQESIRTVLTHRDPQASTAVTALLLVIPLFSLDRAIPPLGNAKQSHNIP